MQAMVIVAPRAGCIRNRRAVSFVTRIVRWGMTLDTNDRHLAILILKPRIYFFSRQFRSDTPEPGTIGMMPRQIPELR